MKWLCIVVLILAVLFFIFLWYDTPMKEPAVSVSPSYWHWLDEHYPREDTAHYLPAPTPSTTPVNTLGG